VPAFQVFEFTTSNCYDFIANDEWPPIHPINPLEYRVWGNVLLQAATEAKNSSRV